MRTHQTLIVVFVLFFVCACKPDKNVSPTDVQKIVGKWQREFVDDSPMSKLDTVVYGKDSVFMRDSKFRYILDNGRVIHIDGTDTVFKVPYKFDGNDKFRTECYFQIGLVCHFNFVRIK